MEQGKFVVEGDMQIGPQKQFFIFLDGEHLGQLVLRHRRIAEERGDTKVGRVRVTVEWLDDEFTEEASPT
jgi:hypothetical protein